MCNILLEYSKILHNVPRKEYLCNINCKSIFIIMSRKELIIPNILISKDILLGYDDVSKKNCKSKSL